MTIFRYLVKEVVATLSATTAILMLIFMCTQFVHYLGNAAIGEYSAKVLLHIMLLQMPYLLGLLIPAGLYFALLLAFGRLYADNEMMVLFACGMSKARLLGMTFIMATVVMVIAAVLNLWVTPIVVGAQKKLVAEAKAAPIIEAMLPGRFFTSHNGKHTLYVEKIARDHQSLHHIFVADEKSVKGKKTPAWSITTAASGGEVTQKAGTSFIQANNGYRYQGTPGEGKFSIIHFKRYDKRIVQHNPNVSNNPQVMSTAKLWHIGNKNRYDAAELQWRLSMPLSVFILALLALPLSQVDPRQGKYAQMVPAVLIYIFYANMMFVVRSWIQLGKISPDLGVWWLHGLVLGVALLCLVKSKGLAKLRRWLRVG